jgi:hypothetical protein
LIYSYTYVDVFWCGLHLSSLVISGFSKARRLNATVFLHNFKSLFWKIINKAMKFNCMTDFISSSLSSLVIISSNCCNNVRNIVAWPIAFRLSFPKV